MQIIYYLGDLISKKIGLSASASRGLIKLSMKDEFNPFQPYKSLRLTQYQQLIKNSLKERLKTLKVDQYEDLVNLLLDELINHQSLITMEKI